MHEECEVHAGLGVELEDVENANDDLHGLIATATLDLLPVSSQALLDEVQVVPLEPWELRALGMFQPPKGSHVHHVLRVMIRLCVHGLRTLHQSSMSIIVMIHVDPPCKIASVELNEICCSSIAYSLNMKLLRANCDDDNDDDDNYCNDLRL